MKIAFASCMCFQVYPQQPVWDWIAAHNPDRLVLLGDSIYLDISFPGVHPRDMLADQFAQHLFQRYTAQMAQPQFARLVQNMPRQCVTSVWDDHDFLWNDMVGSEAQASPVQRDKLPLTTSFQEAFRRALAAGLTPGSFPAAYNDAIFWQPHQPTLTTPSIQIAPDVWLHLADVRTHRTRVAFVPESKRTMLGAAQRGQFEAAIQAAPNAIHLLASGSTVSSYKRFPADWNWLNNLAAKHKMLVLSGDIHRNESDAFFTTGWPLHEATSSGAAVRDAVVLGERRRNYGMLEIDANSAAFKLYTDNAASQKWSRTISRTSWLPI
jgi:alkaline phosphatase D